jgi:hypothetical protein
MKKLISLAAILFTMAGANAATVTLAPLFSNQLRYSVDGTTQTNTALIAVGHWDGTTWTQFGAAFADPADNAAVNGSVTASGPATLNGLQVHVYIGFGTEVNTSSGNFAILRSLVSGTPVAFPSDVSSGIGSSTFFANTASPNTLQLVTGNNATLTNNVVNFVPEPSAALLGALGVVGLLRRRRR